MVRAIVFSPLLIRVFTPLTVSHQKAGVFLLYEAMREAF
jgi:hypothetical protein